MVEQSENSEILSTSSFPLASLAPSCTFSNINPMPNAEASNLRMSTANNLTTRTLERRKYSEEVQDGREFICGWGAAFINITCTFPINKIMFRQMLHGVSTKYAVQQLRVEGIKSLYRGILPPLCQKTLSTSIMFGMYDQYSKLMRYYSPSLSAGIVMSSAAAMAGFTEALLCPFERIQMLMQDKNFHNKFRNTWHCYSNLRVYGIPEYYRGFSLIIFRNATSNIMFFGFRGPIKHKLESWTKDVWWGEFAGNFVSGAVLGAFISTIMYPLNVLKTQQQARVGGRFCSLRETAAHVYRERGMNVFHGIHVNYTRALVSWGIINASYEMLLKMFKT